ncbi:unnamed protein product [Lactuca virosa]|uniref:ATPase AAA-type core domain-containing protein n=1 Tax=Lactuca virosa TaxID=75947 RepID=A0AAU9MXU3_9ASTR|nr:unnamed protein product [Lactuca virosa]
MLMLKFAATEINEGGHVVQGVVTHCSGKIKALLLLELLVELDGVDQRKGVYVIGATNRPEMVDKTLLRPKRMEKLVYVPLPNPDELEPIFLHCFFSEWKSSFSVPTEEIRTVYIGDSDSNENLEGDVSDKTLLSSKKILYVVENAGNDLNLCGHHHSLMRTERISLEDALESLCQSNEYVCPNDGFLEQSSMFEDMGFKVDHSTTI